MIHSFIERILRLPGPTRPEERITAVLMFAYSFLAMTSFNILRPVTRSKFISSLGADNLPYVQLAAGLIIALVMVGYSRLVSRLPGRWGLPIIQGGMAVVLLIFWFLFRYESQWISAAFYVFGLLLGLLLISQFWTLANVVYDPRQAKRLFGFIGGGAPLGGIAGSLILTRYAQRLGTVDLLLPSAALMLVCAAVVIRIIRREPMTEQASRALAAEGGGMGNREALDLLRKSRHLQIIALVISCAAFGSVVIEQQLNMAAAASTGQNATDAITAFLGRVQLWTSMIGFVIQIWLTARIQRHLGVGFALMLLPLSLFGTAALMLLNAALWAPSLARVLDQSISYTIDKTTREILFMPLPAETKFKAKPFVDVTVDRCAKGLAAVLVLVMIKPWGLGLGWQELSYASVLITGIWLYLAAQARRSYRAAFRHSLESREIKPDEIGRAVADPSTLETLIQELASPEEHRVLYAMDMLEALDKRNLITPLLLYHEAPAVRVRALGLLAGAPAALSARWLPAIQRMMRDDNPAVRASAVGALANLRHEQAGELVRPYLLDPDPRIAMTAALVLSGSADNSDARAAEEVLAGLVSDARESAAPVRRDFAVALRHVRTPHFRRLLIPLLNDDNSQVADEALRTIRHLGTADFIFVPTLISLLRHRRLKSTARELLVGYGEGVLCILGHFLRDPEEDLWIRRHIPATIARIPCQQAMDILVRALDEPDGFLRFKIIAALEKLRRTHPHLDFRRETVEAEALRETARLSRYLAIHRNLSAGLTENILVARALVEKLRRARDRVYRLLCVLYPWKDIAAARWEIERNSPHSRAVALEYMDNLLRGDLRKRLVPLLEEARLDGPAFRTSSHDFGQGLLQALRDPDPEISAAASLFIWQRRLAGFVGELESLCRLGDGPGRYAVEAASWALALLRRSSAGHPPLRLEPLPTAELAERLRNLSLFSSVTVDELFRIADAGRQVRYESGRILHREGALPESLLFLLDGSIQLSSGAGATSSLEPPAALGFRELLEGSVMRETARTSETAVCLAVSSEEFRTLLADNSALVQGLFRVLWGHPPLGIGQIISRGRHPERDLSLIDGSLNAIQKVFVLEAIPAFAGVSAEEMLRLAAIAVEIGFSEGSSLFNEADPPALYALIAGELALESSLGDPVLVAGPSDVVGIYETFAGIPILRHARVTRSGTALRIDRDDLFDLLALRPDMIQQLFSALPGANASER